MGQDAFGGQLVETLQAEGIDCSGMAVTSGFPTGVAIVMVDSTGENSIVVAGGANLQLTPDDIFSREELFEGAYFVLLQLELPLPTVRAALDMARRHGCKVILDPAPAPKCLPEALCKVDVICPNATEAESLTGQSVSEERGAKSVASELIARGASTAVLTLGPRGCVVVTADEHVYTVPPYKVPVADTTAAGDAFAAALAVALARGEKIHQAAKFANAAGALACTKFGAQPAMPTLAEVLQLMERQII